VFFVSLRTENLAHVVSRHITGQVSHIHHGLLHRRRAAASSNGEQAPQKGVDWASNRGHSDTAAPGAP